MLWNLNEYFLSNARWTPLLLLFNLRLENKCYCLSVFVCYLCVCVSVCVCVCVCELLRYCTRVGNTLMDVASPVETGLWYTWKICCSSDVSSDFVKLSFCNCKFDSKTTEKPHKSQIKFAQLYAWPTKWKSHSDC